MDDAVCEKKVRVNHGLNVKRIRAAYQMKQEIFAQKLGVTQQMVSLYENQEVMDDKTLEKCAAALDVPVDLLKNMPADESAPIQIFKDVTFSPSDSAIGNQNQVQNQVLNNYNCPPETLEALNDAIRLLKSEIKALKEENKVLREKK